MGLVIALPNVDQQKTFNLRRWREVLVDPVLAKVEGRVETDRFGHVLMSPPPAASHGYLQSQIVKMLCAHLPEGIVITECPVSTADGVRAVDVAWMHFQFARRQRKNVCFTEAPEICIEVISPSNVPSEMEEKRALYFDAGANEVWFCKADGSMDFYLGPNLPSEHRSMLCPNFPSFIEPL